MPHEVRTHTRRTASGRTTTVNQHSRRGDSPRPGKPRRNKRGPNPRHAWKLTKRARSAHKRGMKGIAGMFLLLAAGEVVAWFTLSGTSLILASIAGVLGFISWLLVR